MRFYRLWFLTICCSLQRRFPIVILTVATIEFPGNQIVVNYKVQLEVNYSKFNNIKFVSCV